MNDSSAVRDVRYALADARQLCERLGLLGGRGSFTRQAGGYIVRCPWHEERTPSCSVRRASDGTVSVRCHGCGQTGDALSLVAAVHGLTMRGDDFRQVLLRGAELGGLHSLVVELESGRTPTAPAKPRVVAPPPEPDRDYPPLAEVNALWASTTTLDADASAWAKSRGLCASRIGEYVGDHALARSLPAKGELPRWARYRGASWRETGHRLLVPMFDACGVMRSVRAIRIVEGDSPKRLPPGGHKASGLVMACDIALGMLRGTFVPKRVLVVEGEPDALTWMTARTTYPYARLGIVSGSWTAGFAHRVTATARVYLHTDRDAAGDRYAKEIAASLPANELFRWQGKEG